MTKIRKSSGHGRGHSTSNASACYLLGSQIMCGSNKDCLASAIETFSPAKRWVQVYYYAGNADLHSNRSWKKSYSHYMPTFYFWNRHRLPVIHILLLFASGADCPCPCAILCFSVYSDWFSEWLNAYKTNMISCRWLDLAGYDEAYYEVLNNASSSTRQRYNIPVLVYDITRRCIFQLYRSLAWLGQGYQRIIRFVFRGHVPLFDEEVFRLIPALRTLKIGHRSYVSSYAADWYKRQPMLCATE